jgi:hypothetical protein
MRHPTTSVRSDFIRLLAREIGAEIYLFGYPLVLMDVTRSVFTNGAGEGNPNAPINRLGHARAFSDETFTKFASPNADTLCSSGFLDLSDGPMVLGLPDVGDRYHVMQMLDAWANVFASLGTRTTGNRKRRFVITGPGHKGSTPEDLQKVQSPTNVVWLIGRIQTNGGRDHAAVHALQDQYELAPLSFSGITQPTSRVYNKNGLNAPPVEQVRRMDFGDFLERLSVLMKKNPPSMADAEILRALISVGLLHGKSFKLANLDPLIASGMESGCRLAAEKIVNEANKPQGTAVNGWESSNDLGEFGTDYLRRAAFAVTGLDLSPKEDAVYFRARHEGNGELFDGKNRYAIHFEKGQFPPVNAFWSVTLYDHQNLLVENPLHRFVIGNRDSLKLDPDGSLTLLVQHDPPALGKVSNWLPAPAENFTLTMRLYWPRTEIFSRTWKPPRIHRLAAEMRKAA